MKNIFLFLSVLLGSIASYSYVLEAKPMADLVRQIKESKFEHREDGLVFGFFSIKSCLYVSQDFAILKNYCVPKKDYPAKGYTLISKKFGVIDLYQEERTAGLKRDIEISTFSDVLNDHLQTPLLVSTVPGLSQLLEKLYNLNGPACWSTNVSYYTGKSDVRCNTADVLSFDLWALETQALTSNAKAWDELFAVIEGAITNKDVLR